MQWIRRRQFGGKKTLQNSNDFLKNGNSVKPTLGHEGAFFMPMNVPFLKGSFLPIGTFGTCHK